MERTFRFTFTTVRADWRTGGSETIFLDGKKLSGFPSVTTNERRLLARQLGYASDVVSMDCEQAVLQIWLLEKIGYLTSPTLWEISHPEEPSLRPHLAPQAEVELIQGFQQLLNQPSYPAQSLFSLIQHGLSLRDLRDEAWSLLRVTG